MADESQKSFPTPPKRLDPFILRLTGGFFRRLSYALMIFSFVSAAIVGLFALVAIGAGLSGWKPMDPKLIAMAVFTSLVFCGFGRWCYRIHKL